MIGRDLFIDRRATDAEIVTAIVTLFSLHDRDVMVVGDGSDWPTGAAPRPALIVERWHYQGDFPVRLELHPQTPALRATVAATDRDKLVERLLELLGVRGLVPDDSTDEPDAYVLIAPGVGHSPVYLDAGKYEAEGAISIVRRPASLSA